MNQHNPQTHEINVMRTMSRLDARLETLHQDVAEVKGAMHKLADAITKLAVIEERQSQVSGAVERAFVSIAGVEARVSDLSLRIAALSPAVSTTSKWVDRALVGAVALAAGYFSRGIT